MKQLVWRTVAALAARRDSHPSRMAFAPLNLHVPSTRQLSGCLCSPLSCGKDVATSKTFHIRLRNATIDDLATIQRWDEQPYLQDEDVMGDHDYNDWNWSEELTKQPSWRYQLIAELDSDVPIGMLQIIDPAEEESHYWGENCPPNLRAVDIWIGEHQYLGQGYGTQMMKIALEDYCFSNPNVTAVLVDPMANNLRAHKFYQKLGFEPQEIRYFGPDQTLVHRLTRETYERKQSEESLLEKLAE
jgi:aminoglycoside 6'-N-acetyltransferase